MLPVLSIRQPRLSLKMPILFLKERQPLSFFWNALPSRLSPLLFIIFSSYFQTSFHEKSYFRKRNRKTSFFSKTYFLWDCILRSLSYFQTSFFKNHISKKETARLHFSKTYIESKSQHLKGRLGAVCPCVYMYNFLASQGALEVMYVSQWVSQWVSEWVSR